MEINYLGGLGFRIKTKTATAIVGKIENEVSVENSGFVITGPGEYEVGGVSVVGVAGSKNPIYVIEIEGLRVCYLGGTDSKLSDNQLSEIGATDVVLVSVAGEAKTAVELVKQVDPWVAMPMNGPVENFLKEMGSSVTSVPKLVITAEKLPSELQVVVLDSKSK